MNGTEIITFLIDNLPLLATPVSAVVGGLLTTIFLRRNTSAKEFEKIKACKFHDVVNDLLESGEMTHTEYYKANNFLMIAERADKYYSELPQRKTNETFDYDWFNRFYEASGNISNEEMQDLWAKVLAGEINEPSAFSLRTIDILKNMNKEEAGLFQKVCRHSFTQNGRCFIPRYDIYLEKAGLRYTDVMKLSELGLVYNDSSIFLSFKPPEKNSVLLSNDDFVIECKTEQIGNEFRINQYPFTQVGCELASINGLSTSEDDFRIFVNILNDKINDARFSLGRIVDRSVDHIQFVEI